MRSVLEMVQEWVDRGDRVGLATVVETKKSAPQPTGTKMAINGSQHVCGAVSGGCLARLFHEWVDDRVELRVELLEPPDRVF